MQLNNSSDQYILRLTLLTVGLLALLSMMPWAELTGNRVKSFNLLADLMPTATEAVSASVQSIVDPELEELLNGASDAPGGAEGANPGPEIGVSAADSIAEEDGDSLKVYDVPPPAEIVPNSIENYSGAPVLARFKAALAEADRRPVRVAVVGDSYIEGDIFCQNLRDCFRETYGGAGVGYMAMHSDFPGFRNSVTQSGSGWSMHDIRNMGRSDSLRILPGAYGKAAGSATASYAGTSKYRGTDRWTHTTFAFIAPDSGTVSISTPAGASTSQTVYASGAVQTITLPAYTGSVKISSDVPGLVGLGVYLDGDAGVAVDCMSVRGNSGLNLRSIKYGLTSQLRSVADYDLIIVEYGMNVLSGEQKDYTPYMLQMVKSIEALRKQYPKADIIIMGVGDRGVKVDGTVTSLGTAGAMTKAQRELARRTGTHFYDTRLAMGGPGSIVDWRDRKLVNADYIHLNHAGGKELAKLFHKAIEKALDQ
ncbi:MAG: hypothetical protein K2M55_03005 [Muribaculaceae bacterium]|nr:hypothetical protein [Muribaculaceae bacterium]